MRDEKDTRKESAALTGWFGSRLAECWHSS